MSDEEKKDEVVYDFSEPIQKKIVAMFLFDRKAYLQNAEIVREQFFDNPILKNIIVLISNFYTSYSRVPTLDEFLEELDVFLENNEKLPREEYFGVVEEIVEVGVKGDFQYVKDKVIDFARYQGVKGVILDSAKKHLKKRKYETILSAVQEAMSVGEDLSDLGIFYYDKLDERIASRKAGKTRRAQAIPTGFGKLDSKMGGGLGRRECTILMGPTKRGKTTIAANIAKGAMLYGKNVLHYGFEGNEDETQVIYDASITGIPKHDLEKNSTKVKSRVDDFFKSPSVGRLVIKHFPAGGASAWTIESHLQKLKTVENFEPSLVIIDYLNLVRPADKQMKFEGSTSGRFFMLGVITKEFISLGQRYGYSVLLLMQATRGSKSKVVVDWDDAGESILPIQDADAILTINQTDEEQKKRPQVLRIFGAGGRAIEDRWSVKFEMDREKALIWEYGTRMSLV